MSIAFGHTVIDGAHRQQAASGITSAIANASSATGVNFSYLLQQANIESGMNPTAKARGSSATGLYQFIDQTWLRMVKTYGADHGYARYANAIHQNANGDYSVSSPTLKRDILNLRKDPTAASLMAGEYANENADYLRSRTGQNPNATDLYLAHFLGAGGAARFINAKNSDSLLSGAELFPNAAASNKNIFYKDGRALSLGEIYAKFDSKFTDGGSATSLLAANSVEPKSQNFGSAHRAYGAAQMTIPSSAFSATPQDATAWLPELSTGNATDGTDMNPIASLLSAPFRLLGAFFG